MKVAALLSLGKKKTKDDILTLKADETYITEQQYGVKESSFFVSFPFIIYKFLTKNNSVFQHFDSKNEAV